MKKRLTFITFLMLFCSTVFGQTSHWGTPYTSDKSMTIYGSILLNGEIQYRDDIEIGAFCGEELRGYAFPVASGDDYIFVLDIAGKKNNEVIEFKLYHPEFTTPEGIELIDDIDLEHIVRFRNNDIIHMDINFIPSFWDKYEIVPVIEDFDQSMSVISFINIDGEFQNRSDLEIASFCGEDLRAIARPIYNKNTDQYIVNLYIYGNEDDEEMITFKLYDHSGNIQSESLPLTADYSVPFVDGQIVGRPPISLNFVYQSIAKVGEQYFTTLAAAVEAATEDNNVITLLKEVTGDGFVINKDVTIDFAGFAYTLNEGEVISIQEGGVATFVNDANITEGVELFGGQLYTTNNNLTIVAKKAFENVTGGVGSKEGWGTISTPIANVTIPSNDNHDLYRYDEKNASWRFYTGTGSPFTTFELGQGYLYANKEDITIELSGELNTQPVSMGISYTEAIGALAGFNFVGNPFAHNISEANFTTTDGAQLSNGFYVVSTEGAIVVRPENAVIAPMESVMVQTNATTTLTINNAPASKRSAIDNGRLEINVANANYSDVAYVSFNEGKGLNKIGHRNTEIPMVYVPVDGVNYAIAMMSQDVTEIPVSFQAATMGQYTIGVEAQDCEYAMMTLVDRFTGIETNLLLEDYTFIAKSNDSAERFIIKLAMNNGNGDVNENFAFINNGMMYIYNIEGQGTISVYDVTGRPVAEYDVATSANIPTSEFAAGIYIIRMSDENGVKVQKIVVE